jgi:hypothetical protein
MGVELLLDELTDLAQRLRGMSNKILVPKPHVSVGRSTPERLRRRVRDVEIHCAANWTASFHERTRVEARLLSFSLPRERDRAGVAYEVEEMEVERRPGS